MDEPDQDENEWSGIDRSVDKGKSMQQEEYEDEDQLATVTVVEEFDPHAIIYGPPRTHNHSQHSSTRLPAQPTIQPLEQGGKPGFKIKAGRKVKKVHYESKSARTTEKRKQRARRTEKAERAGGKARRHSNNRAGKRER